VSFTLTYPCRLFLFRVLLEACPFCFLQYTALPACCNCSPFLFRVHVGECASHSPVERATHYPLLDTFPSPSTLREVVLYPPSTPGLFIYSWHGEMPLPPTGGAFHRTATVTSFAHSKFAGQMPPLLFSPAGLVIYSSCWA
jgi:hypothetical protein